MITQIVEILRSWIDTLAGMVIDWRETWRARDAVEVSLQDGDIHLKMMKSGREIVHGPFSTAAPLPPEAIRIARHGLIILNLPPDEVVARRINVPAQARAFLSGIIRNQIERLSPWQPDQVAYGFAAEQSQDDPAQLDVRILLVPLRAIAAVCDRLSKCGIAADRIVSRERGQESSGAIALWSRLVNGSTEDLARSRRMIAAGLAGWVGLSAAVSLWAVVSTSRIHDTHDDVTAQVAQLRARLEGPISGQSGASANPAENAWHAKATSLSAVIALEALSRALPDTAYLSEFNLQNQVLRISGLTSDAPSLIAPLETSGHFTDVHFFAPTTRAPRETQFTFHIEAKVDPHTEIVETEP